jgi:hypothetical protein
MMRAEAWRNGSVAVYGDTADEELLIVEPFVTAYMPAYGNSRCICGAQLSLRQSTEGAEISCHRCHRVHGYIRVGARVHR